MLGTGIARRAVWGRALASISSACLFCPTEATEARVGVALLNVVALGEDERPADANRNRSPGGAVAAGAAPVVRLRVQFLIATSPI
jgi:hypothetical protein